MRIMAGLDRPTEGRVLADGVDVTGVPVRQRNVAMVYQQFINYPSMTVFDNIASPLKLRGESAPRRSWRWRRGCTSTTWSSAIRPSCPAASSSAWRWRARWPERAADPAGRAAGQPGLQAARRAARRTERAVRGRALDRDLCHHRARRGAAAGRLYGGARRRAAAAVRTHGASVPPPVLHPRGARFQRSSHEPVRCRAAPAASSCRAACAWTGPCLREPATSPPACAPARWTCMSSPAISRWTAW